MRNQYKILAEVYKQGIQESIPSTLHTPVPKAMASEAKKRVTDFIDDSNFDYNDIPYTIDAGFVWEERAVGHQASIGHYGVDHKDVMGLVPVSIKWIEVTDDNGKVVTDPDIIKSAEEFALIMARENL